MSEVCYALKRGGNWVYVGRNWDEMVKQRKEGDLLRRVAVDTIGRVLRDIDEE